MDLLQDGPKETVMSNLPQSFIEDELFLGPQTGESVAKRRAGCAPALIQRPLFTPIHMYDAA
jgi:hypothetical protein